MGKEVKVSLKQGLINPMFCVVCGGTTKLHPRGYSVTGNTYQLLINYWGIFNFPVCEKCAIKRGELFKKKKRFRTPEEKDFLKLYDKKAVQIRISHHPLLGIKEAKFIFYRQDFAEAFAKLNSGKLI